MRNQYLTRGALLIALGVALPQVFHFIGGTGPIFLPMHIPVLLAGLMIGPWVGLIVGLLSPLLSHFITGMPPMAPLPMLIFMMVELPAMGLIAGLVFRKLHLNIIVSLIIAMLSGRIVLGLAIMLMSGQLGYTLPPVWTYISGSVLTGLPGIAIQVFLIPVLVMATERRSRRWSATLR